MVYLVLDKSWKYKNDFYGSSAERRCYLVVWWYDRCHVSWKWQLKKKKWGFLSLTSWIDLPDEGAVVLVFSRGAARINNNDSYLVVALKMAAGVLNCQTLTSKWIWLHSMRQKLMLECINHIFLWSISHLCVGIRPKTSKKTLFLGILKVCSACSWKWLILHSGANTNSSTDKRSLNFYDSAVDVWVEGRQQSRASLNLKDYCTKTQLFIFNHCYGWNSIIANG